MIDWLRMAPMFAVSFVFFSSGAAYAAGDAEAGHRLAKQWCNTCHVVEESGSGPHTAPPFPVIAANRKDRRWIRAWLAAPHPPMPNLNLTRQEIDDIVAYLDRLTPR